MRVLKNLKIYLLQNTMVRRSKSTMYWIIPVILGIGIKKINDGKKIYSLQFTPFIEISFSYMDTLYMNCEWFP